MVTWDTMRPRKTIRARFLNTKIHYTSIVKLHMEELKKKFIVEEKLDEKVVSECIEKILPFCKVSKNGEVIIEKKNMTVADRIKLALTARFLANYLEREISAETTAKELSSFLYVPENQISARLKELKDSKFAIRVKKGVYTVNPLQIRKFVHEIETKYGAK
nr:hypothetical protein [Candidatus Baldrarchaeota archaeon]